MRKPDADAAILTLPIPGTCFAGFKTGRVSGSDSGVEVCMLRRKLFKY